MDDYIKRQAAKRLFADGHDYGLARRLDEIPAADVVEVRHGRWEYDFALDGSNFYRCSLCGRQEVLLEKEDIAEWCPYCHCGARMDGE